MQTGILLAAALLPAVLLMLYIYRKDTVEKEPPKLVARMLLLGIVAGPLAALLEGVLVELIEALPTNAVFIIVLENFIGVALVEEGLKYLFLNTVRNNPHFNYVFDGIVYGVAVSLGFAALENILYVIDGGLEVAILRALLSVPGHCAGGVLMGLLFGLAKKFEMQKDHARSELYYLLAFLIPTLEHGFYDMALSTENDLFALLGVVVEVGFIISAFVLVNIISKNDEAIYGHDYPSLDWISYQQQAYMPRQLPMQQSTAPQVPSQQQPYPQQAGPQQQQYPQQDGYQQQQYPQQAGYQQQQQYTQHHPRA